MRAVPWVLLVVALAAGGVLAYRLLEQRQEEAEARRGAEAEALEAAGQILVERRTRVHLEREVERLEAGNAELAAALAKARRAAPGARPVAVASASTGSVVVEASPDSRPIVAGESPAAVPCLLASGERAEVRIDEVVLETQAGNRLLVGAASAWRLEPGPPLRLFGGPFVAPLTSAESVTPPPEGVPAWVPVAVGVGALVLGGLAGYGLGR